MHKDKNQFLDFMQDWLQSTETVFSMFNIDVWRPTKQSDVTAKHIELFLIRFSPQEFLAVTSLSLESLHIS